ncbi:uncharacterized protein SCHCODRAFT_01300596 [Schizophyllum commune H4-8]|uniref:uncharacterized protein n=1 Tax=Schizophyllum commune (strain H4-8 / FGSC 9210) TaxID=578458 RepID=UPI00215EA388|nr:uncharacterized protein SCHCODRAFT_01300596 [Schizophyllum commune H4-8]KAI5892283.1 hypothetical protein SCHCODRAFT_01300596 [Schizophyllum commune H4-8]
MPRDGDAAVKSTTPFTLFTVFREHERKLDQTTLPNGSIRSVKTQSKRLQNTSPSAVVVKPKAREYLPFVTCAVASFVVPPSLRSSCARRATPILVISGLSIPFLAHACQLVAGAVSYPETSYKFCGMKVERSRTRRLQKHRVSCSRPFARCRSNSPAVFDADPVLRRNIGPGKARLVKGDRSKQDDVAHAWAEAAKDKPVDTLLFTIGRTPRFSLTEGFPIEPHSLVTRCLLNTLCTIPKHSPHPRIAVVSSIACLQAVLSARARDAALRQAGRRARACALRRLPVGRGGTRAGGGHRGRELARVQGPSRLGRAAEPALLTHGECEADKGIAEPYTASEQEPGDTVSRKDVGNFIAQAIMTIGRSIRGRSSM